MQIPFKFCVIISNNIRLMTLEDAGDAALATIRLLHICGSATKINNNFNITRIYIYIYTPH